jgi:phosphoserine phosphatase
MPPVQRIAAIDNDGTLWCEKPMYAQMAYILDNLRERVEGIPALMENATIKSLLLGNLAAIRSVSIAQFLDMLTTAYHGPLPEEIDADINEWLARARHPRFNVGYMHLVYQPMLELVNFLRSNGFMIVICSGGGTEFVRVIAEQCYGVAREYVIGTAMDYDVTLHDGRQTLMRESSLYGRVNEGEGKPVNIQIHIGRQPIMAVGNSSGDIEMLRMADANTGPGLCLMINHDDAVREYAYEGASTTVRSAESAVETARRLGWTVVSMKNDWKRIFAFTT